MIEFIMAFWPLALALIMFILGTRLGHAVGVNDGLRRAHDIMDEAHRNG